MPTHEFGPGFREGVERGFDGGFRASAGGPALGTVAPARPDVALEELRLRYARGEMTREDYADRLHDLTTGTAVPRPSTGGSPEPPPPDA